MKRLKGICGKNVKLIQTELDFIDACFDGKYEEVKKMLGKSGLSANTKDFNDNTALMEAALKGNLKICKLLLIHHPEELDINAVNKDCKTALHKAAYNGNSSIIELLLKSG